MKVWSLKHLATDFRNRSTALRVGKGPRSVGVSRTEDQLPRVHVTEALFTLTLDTPVRRWVEGVALGLGLDEAARRVSVEDAP